MTQKEDAAEKSLVFFETGFHGDRYLLQVVDHLLKDCDGFIETGANVGSTLAYVARNYPGLGCFSCEPHPQAFAEARKHTAACSNVALFNKTSREFFSLIREKHADLFKKKIFCWLDAHGRGYDWTLKDEMVFITSYIENACILIDDFNVPGLDCFAFEKYKEQTCSFEFIKESIKTTHFNLYYPSYTQHTSTHHPLIGWGLIMTGKHNHFKIPPGLQGIIRHEPAI